VKTIGGVRDLCKGPRKETGILTSIINVDVASFDNDTLCATSLYYLKTSLEWSRKKVWLISIQEFVPVGID
jgi:hypothetical protein